MADVVIIDASSGAVIERDFTPEEAAQRQADQQAWAVIKAAEDITEGNRTTLQQRVQNALATNANYLALPSPTNAQAVAQVRVLTQECSAVIRLLLNLLDTTD